MQYCVLPDITLDCPGERWIPVINEVVIEFPCVEVKISDLPLYAAYRLEFTLLFLLLAALTSCTFKV